MFLQLPLTTYYKEHQEIYEDIILFEHYIHEEVHISAADIFNIDGRRFFGVIGTIMSYLIISIGFDKNRLKIIDLENIHNTTDLIN